MDEVLRREVKNIGEQDPYSHARGTPVWARKKSFREEYEEVEVNDFERTMDVAVLFLVFDFKLIGCRKDKLSLQVVS